MPDDLGFLRRSLRTLRLDNNHLVAVPPAFATLQALEELFLDQNRISEFGGGLLPGAFPALKRLFLNDNGLSKWVSSAAPPPPAGALASSEAQGGEGGLSGQTLLSGPEGDAQGGTDRKSVV